MTERRHESEDLEDYEVLDSSDTLDGPPGDDPLDRGVATPERWSAPIRTGGTADESQAGESLDDLLAEEEPDIDDDDLDDDYDEPDENAPQEDVRRTLLDEGPDARTGRLTAEDDDPYASGEDPYYSEDGQAVGYDAGIDGGAATAEEAAIHAIDDDDAG